ncbi:uncharacterized protein LOC113938095 [Zalophus californianus]|uniref:Uncharacterized protein LOC113938095 n=1 Tax=Zalophus californianus TaxID=9704 RepID=A0A6J2FGA9_ZALCA|nr:uncharacterized protein LOC113938095 [Zalophus californianus]
MLDRRPIFSLGFASASAGASGSGLGGGGWQGSRSARTRGPARGDSGPRPRSSASGGSAPEGAFPHLDLRTPAHPTLVPLVQFRKLLASVPGRLFPRGRREPWVAAQLPLPPRRPSVLFKSVWDAGAFGNLGPLAPCGRGGPLVGAGTSARLWPRLLFQEAMT